MYREEWPSERKLERLREEGKVPYSRFAVAGAVLLAVGLWSLAAAEGEWRSLLNAVTKLSAVAAGDQAALRAGAAAALRAAVLLLLAPAAAAFVAAVVAGLAQTRFLLRPGLAGFNLHRLTPFKPLSLADIALRVLSACFALALFSLLSVVAARLVFPAAAGTLNAEPAVVIYWPLRLWRLLAPFVLAVVAVAAFGAALWARLRFMLVHRMSREELEAEARESGY